MINSQNKLHLQRTRDLISDPGRWTTEVYARDSNGHSVIPNSPDAVCWCLIGAYAKVSGFSATYAGQELYDMINCPPTSLNDNHGHQVVIDHLDDLIES
jgi:hypothetical protein